MNRRELGRLLSLALWGGALGDWPRQASAASRYPDKPIRLIVPFPAGGAVDILGRLIGEHLTAQWGQSVIVDNRPGANGNVATEQLAKTSGDGYTLLIAGNGLATNTALYPKSNYNMVRDIAPVAFVGSAPLIFVVPAQSPYHSLQELVAAARANPSAVTFASAGNGSSAHLGAELLKNLTHTEMLHVPYKGGAPAIVDLISDRVSFMLLDPPQSMPQIRSGKLRAIAVGSTQRFDLLPEVPTAIEAGYPHLETTVWWGVVAPKSTPPELVTELNTQINRVLALPTVQARLKELGITTQAETVDQFDKYMRGEIAKWLTVVKAAGIQGD